MRMNGIRTSMLNAVIIKLVPQLQEGITKAEWVNYNDISDKMVNTYGNIKDVLRHVEI